MTRVLTVEVCPGRLSEESSVAVQVPWAVYPGQGVPTSFFPLHHRDRNQFGKDASSSAFDVAFYAFLTSGLMIEYGERALRQTQH